MNRWEIRRGHVLDELRKMEPESVHCVVTSPPYYGLRNYGLPPQVWGGEPSCEHRWVHQRWYVNGGGSTGTNSGAFSAPGESNARRIKDGRWREASTCECGAWRGSLGLEPSLEMYIAHILEVFREVWRVLRRDGSLWLNLGDSYANDGKWGGETGGKQGYLPDSDRIRNGRQQSRTGLKPKDLVGLPWRITLALQSDGVADLPVLDMIQRIRGDIVEDHREHGETPSDRVLAILDRVHADYAEAKGESWWLRSDVVWSKPNPMPESVKDRPTRAHEYLFLLTKAERYYYDHVAIREPMAESSLVRISQPSFWEQKGGPKDYGVSGVNPSRSGRRALENFAAKRTPAGRNVNHDESDLRGRYPQRRAPGRSEQLAEVDAEFKREKRRGHSRSHDGHLDEGSKEDQQVSGAARRDVWHIATQPFPGTHFATFPVALVEPCVLAGTSARGVCLVCRAPWRRIVIEPDSTHSDDADYGSENGRRIAQAGDAARAQGGDHDNPFVQPETLGWEPTCDHDSATVPPVVLDPFAGSGTVGVVALRHGRDFVGIELNPEYVEMAERRIVDDAPLFNSRPTAVES